MVHDPIWLDNVGLGNSSDVWGRAGLGDPPAPIPSTVGCGLCPDGAQSETGWNPTQHETRKDFSFSCCVMAALQLLLPLRGCCCLLAVCYSGIAFTELLVCC